MTTDTNTKDLLLPGIFTVSDDGRKVRFSKGNLMACVSTDGSEVHEWKIAERQFDTVGDSPAQQQCKGGWVDLFGWTPEGKYADGIRQYGINTSQDNSDYSLNENSDSPCDWGSLIAPELSMLSRSEWEYLLEHVLAKNSSGKNEFTIAGQKCAILKPDGYTGTVADIYNAQEWAVAEADGLVAIPFAGYRDGSSVGNAGDNAFCWSSVPNGSGCACLADVFADLAGLSSGYRYYGQSVRLVSVV